MLLWVTIATISVEGRARDDSSAQGESAALSTTSTLSPGMRQAPDGAASKRWNRRTAAAGAALGRGMWKKAARERTKLCRTRVLHSFVGPISYPPHVRGTHLNTSFPILLI
jgi:hypothetical protein